VPKLFVQDGDRSAIVDLRPGESVRIGRSEDCGITVRAPRASRRHAEIVATAGGHAVRDLGSTNGTLRNGAPVESDVPLEDGDVLELAGARVVYRSRP
jgi:pSer/pThr/pTyr-binding forkhead associated (FHA) protein